MAKNAQVVVPSSETIAKILDLVRPNPEAVEYFRDGLQSVLKASGNLETPEGQQVMKSVNECVDMGWDTYKRNSMGRILEASDFQFTTSDNAATARGAIAADNLHERISSDELVNVYVAVSDEADLLRSYMKEGQALSPEEAVLIDHLLNEFLAEQDMVTSDSTLYERDEKGQVKKDASGNRVKADTDKARKLIKEDFSAFMEKKDFKVEGKLLTHPEDKKKAAAAPPQQAPSTPEAPVAPSNDNEPEQPTVPKSN